MKLNILIVDDDDAHREMIKAVLAEDGYIIHEADDGKQAIELVEKQFFSLILMDIKMKNVGGIEAFSRIKDISPSIPVIMITAYASVDTAVKALKLGAFDYITKPIDIDELKIAVEKAINYKQLEQENIYLKERIGDKFDLAGMVGKSRAMKKMFETLELISPSDANVLITGESGTGKELIANAIHQNSNRKDKAFIKVNCAAIPENLLESELFGHEKGAFTGAIKKKIGRFQAAHEGSIFLDEIAEMAPATQAKILRVLQEQEFEPVGGAQTITVDTRIIAATNKDLEKNIEKGLFREDLYYRLNVVQVEVPSLKDRRHDITILAEYFLKRFAEKNHKMIKGISAEATDMLIRYLWPGNVRELENVIERAVILTRGEYISPVDLPQSINLELGLDDVAQSMLPVGVPLKEVEKEVIISTLEENNGNRTKTAEVLGISRRTLQLKLKEYGVN
jgi:two-component system response regulator HydG